MLVGVTNSLTSLCCIINLSFGSAIIMLSQSKNMSESFLFNCFKTCRYCFWTSLITAAGFNSLQRYDWRSIHWQKQSWGWPRQSTRRKPNSWLRDVKNVFHIRVQGHFVQSNAAQKIVIINHWKSHSNLP